MLSSNKDTDFLILQYLDDKSLFEISTVCKYIAGLCGSDIFWMNRTVFRYPLLVKYYDYRTWKSFYLKMMFYINKIKDTWGIPYIPSSKYNPEVVYKEEISYTCEDAYNNLIAYVGETGDIELAKLFFDKEADALEDLIAEAAYHNKLSLLNFLIKEKGAEPHNEALFGAASAVNYKLIEHLMSTYNIKNVDHGYLGAVKSKNIQLMEYFESLGFKKFEAGLYFASELGYADIVTYFLNKFSFAKPEKVESLRIASIMDRPDIVKIYVEGDFAIWIDTEIAHNIWLYVFGNDSIGVARYLIDLNPNIDLDALLKSSVVRNSKSCVKLIVAKGATNLNAALKKAKRLKRTSITKFLNKEISFRKLEYL